ncbi:Adenylate cyclase, class 3 [Lishizhenia tianjinensis]|uniref:Adenylate cyclase, class 3 n=1 Tax=Lishizhenia tianjinensis TaxID=477690 RepID=A0A1I7BDE9_9FLAO|nr:adenylate/guanylate cyclase domain-containing protein [Lishizhenia tianjinensis]SFT85197.1 Adenylate cyclase, class 3 [Lishizhenia tianjinensis]
MKQILVFLTLLLCLSSAIGQENIQFNNYTIKDGLSQSVSTAMIQDNFGALWIGTQDGLNRFNGSKFDVFTSGETKGIENEFILCATKDKRGYLYFGTYKGVIIYNPFLQSFETVYSESGARKEVNTLAFLNDEIWAGTEDGRLLVLTQEKGKKFLKVKKPVFLRSGINSIEEGNKNELILSTQFGRIFQYNIADEELVELKTQLAPNSRINKIKKFSKDSLFICTTNGLFTYNLKDESLHVFSEQLLKFDIQDLHFNQETLYLASAKNGFVRVNRNKKDQVPEIFMADFFQKNAIADNHINFIYEDLRGVIWVGSNRGISSYNPMQKEFVSVGISTNPQKGLNTLSVWSLTKNENNQNLYVATDKGVSMYHHKQRRFYHYTRLSSTGEQMASHPSLSLHEMHNGNLLVGNDDGLFHLIIDTTDYNNYSFKRIQMPSNRPPGFNLIYDIEAFDEDTYLFGTKGGVAVWFKSTDTWKFLVHKLNDGETIGPGSCRLIFKSLDGKFYTAPSSGSLYELRYNKKGEFIAEQPNFYRKIKLTIQDYITTVYQPNADEYWFGTLGGGLHYFNQKTEEIKSFTKAQGLPNEVIYGIKSTDGKDLFLSSNRGIIKYSIPKNKFTSYTEEDGLLSDEFNMNAAYQDAQGNIYFGGIMGYNYFHPSKLNQVYKRMNVYFSSLWLENEKIIPGNTDYLAQNLALTKTITVPYNHRTLSLSFYADDFSNPQQINYKYKLKGDDEVEELLGDENQIRFTSISPGIYTLHVYARRGNGEWTSLPASITIMVEKAFWMTWWFRITVALLFALFIFIYIRKRIDTARREQVILELRIKERTHELEEKNREIEKQKKKIEEQKAKIEKQKDKVEEQKNQSDSILRNVLPSDTLTQLKREGKANARGYETVSVMFTDFVGFTTISDNLEPQELVSILDRYFRKFDDIIGQHDLEKIKTIGDAYMCAGGVPIRNKTNPIDTVLAALKIREFVKEEQERAKETGDIQWKVRIGINTGPVSAGIIGTKRFAYDVWGKTVNHAQRMERLSQPGRIAITGSTFEHIEAYFECSFAGIAESKSKGKIDMYFVDSIKPELSVNGEGILPNEAFYKLVNLHHFSSINYMNAERKIMRMLKKRLSPNLHYHSVAHTIDVTRQAERIAIGEGITDKDLFLLKSAASYHDAGFIEQYEKNEPIGARMAEEVLPEYGYTEEDIARIKELIYSTAIPHNPKNHLEEIICDADLDYLGRDDFHEIADKLKQELMEHGKIASAKEWDMMQVAFLKMHKYFTKTSIETRRPKKMENLKEIEERLAKDDY